jgi:hypothetical protein
MFLARDRDHRTSSRMVNGDHSCDNAAFAAHSPPPGERRFPDINTDEPEDSMNEGDLVCLCDRDGVPAAARLNARGAWELAGGCRDAEGDAPLHADSLFIVLCRGDHVAFQCLG